MIEFTDDELRFIKMSLIANGSRRAWNIAEKIPIEGKPTAPKKRVYQKPHERVTVSEKPYKTAPDYPPANQHD